MPIPSNEICWSSSHFAVASYIYHNLHSFSSSQQGFPTQQSASRTFVDEVSCAEKNYCNLPWLLYVGYPWAMLVKMDIDHGDWPWSATVLQSAIVWSGNVATYFHPDWGSTLRNGHFAKSSLCIMVSPLKLQFGSDRRQKRHCNISTDWMYQPVRNMIKHHYSLPSSAIIGH